MASTHSFVPKIDISTNGVQCQVFSKILFGGDQLTAERARSAQRCRSNGILPEDQIRRLVSIASDWHAKQCFLQVYIFNITCTMCARISIYLYL